MNILYISTLSSNISAGPNWSVPASIDAQSKIDNVLWIDLGVACQSHWKEVAVYHNIEEYGGKLSLGNLPAPFNSPDVVVFEGFYQPKHCFFALELKKKGVPYVIVPRGSLTHQSLNNHAWLKKKIAHFFLFDRFTKNALAIQYLTNAEYEDSTDKWNKNHIIVPNGFKTPSERKTSFSADAVKAVFIGRLDIYHKGLGMLLNVCSDLADELRAIHFTIDLYGPVRNDYEKIKQTIIGCGLDDMIVLKGEIGGDAKKNAILGADLMLLTSRFEGHPMGLIEALAYGLPCLVTRGSNMADEIISANAGWACETDEDSLKCAFCSMIEEHSQLSDRGANAYDLALNYDWDVLARRFHGEMEKFL